MGVILKLERFSHLSDWSFGLGSSIGLGYWYVTENGYLEEGFSNVPREDLE